MGSTSDSPPALVVLRGNSASGKSTVAGRVQRSLARGDAAVVGQDHLRREMLWSHDRPGNDAIGLIANTARYCLDLGRVTIVEGIMMRELYGEMLMDLISAHERRGGAVLVYYLEVPLAETLRRHGSKPLSATVTEEQVASWYVPHDLLGLPREHVLDEAWSEDQIVHRVLDDLREMEMTCAQTS